MNPNNDIDKLVELLDSQVNQGTGHINVIQTTTKNTDENKTLSDKNLACNSYACQVPTLLDIKPKE